MSQRGLRLTAMATLVAAAATTAAAETSSWSQRTILAPGKSAPAQGNGWNAVPELSFIRNLPAAFMPE